MPPKVMYKRHIISVIIFKLFATYIGKMALNLKITNNSPKNNSISSFSIRLPVFRLMPGLCVNKSIIERVVYADT